MPKYSSRKYFIGVSALVIAVGVAVGVYLARRSKDTFLLDVDGRQILLDSDKPVTDMRVLKEFDNAPEFDSEHLIAMADKIQRDNPGLSSDMVAAAQIRMAAALPSAQEPECKYKCVGAALMRQNLKTGAVSWTKKFCWN